MRAGIYPPSRCEIFYSTLYFWFYLTLIPRILFHRPPCYLIWPALIIVASVRARLIPPYMLLIGSHPAPKCSMSSRYLLHLGLSYLALRGLWFYFHVLLNLTLVRYTVWLTSNGPSYSDPAEISLDYHRWWKYADYYRLLARNGLFRTTLYTTSYLRLA